MKKILVTGATGQIGTELVPALRKKYGFENVIAAGHSRTPAEDLKSGPYIIADVTDYKAVEDAIKSLGITHIFHLSSILSAGGEKNPELAFQVNIIGLHNILEAARKNNVQQVVYPSSIAAFGIETPKDSTPNETIQRPATIYGISKVFGELLGNYYFKKFGLDVRGVRFPGIISWKEEPIGGTTDYAVQIFYAAVREGCYTCYLREDTALPMMYIPDAIKVLIDLSEADINALNHHADFNVNSMSFTPAQLADAIRKEIPGFAIEYKIDPLKQAIADSWPASLDDSAARKEWSWKPSFDISDMTKDMVANLRRKLKPMAVQTSQKIGGRCDYR